MKKTYSHNLLIIAILLFSNFVFSQSKEISIKFIGNCALYMTDGNLNIYVDFPYKSGAHGYMKYNQSEIDNLKDDAIFLFTHKHADHYSGKLVRKLKGKKYGPWNISKFGELNDSTNEFSIQMFKTKHLFTFRHYSYLITWHGKKIYINGDTGDVEPISKIKNIDWLFAPYWIYSNAVEENITLDTKHFAIYHLYPDQIIPKETPKDIFFVSEQNKIFTIPY